MYEVLFKSMCTRNMIKDILFFRETEDDLLSNLFSNT